MSDEIDINPEVSEDQLEAAPEAPEAPEAEDFKVHPAYEKLLSELPEAWHNKIVPHLQEQDKYFQQQLEKYTPFKEFIDSGLNPAVIRDSIKLADVAVNDPVALYRNLADHLRSQGLLDEADAADKTADNIEDSDDYELDPAIRKEFEARDELIRQQQEYLESIEFEKEVAYEQQQLEAQLEDINSKYEITPAQLDRIMKLMEIQLERGEDATIYTAARELAEITGIRYQAKGTLPKQDAPFVMGNNGGAGVPSEPLVIPKDDKSKKAMLEQMFAAQLKNN
nr:MAG TPA_asm: hypothetical protein [Caudoviricetes sp.]